MKKFIVCLAFIGVIFLTMLSANYAETHYFKKAEVMTVVGNSVSIEDENGDRWLFYGKGFKRGDKVRVIMYNNHTDLNIYDDEIVKVKKI